ncbi:MAG: thioredoxin domain-containing protein [Gammaproteobacteria bacterium]|nr:MAG: thioredoxin domain-containing protein [Gammaproteobacteria bacterium]
MNEHTNQLINETSPYLLQHAHNPVDWYPWGPEALEKARTENKPILLSVGYSACHWCHVMAHESFEDPATADLMNKLFINIKVDREERPDIDKIYQTAHSLLTQRPGGWPLTVFMTPDDQVPFFAGTYFPNEPRHGMPSFIDLMQRIVDFLASRETEIRKQNASLVNALQSIAAPVEAPGTPGSQPLDTARQQLEKGFDEKHGGFGTAPKFPHPTNIERLLRHWAGTGGQDRRALHMAVFTLEQMARGGMYDQLGGGFCRYSVDDRWMIPHFEKMLYDNGALLALYAEAWAATGNPLFRRSCEQTAAWVMREMQAESGGYYSSLDADSEGEEGKFYVWTPETVKELLEEAEYALIARHFGLDRPANFEGHWHFHVYRTREQLAQEFSLDPATVDSRLASAIGKLFAARTQRVHPGRDDKVLTSWNGLMIRGMACAGRYLGETNWIDSAGRAVDFIREHLWQDGRLLATYKDGRAHLNAYLDDHVYLLDGLLELLQARWRDSDLLFAIELAEVVLEHFRDPAGGFFFTSDDHETLIQRPKPNHDDATPSGNGVAAKVLSRLGHLLGESPYLEAAEQTLKGLWTSIEQMPHGHASLLVALEESLSPVQTVIVRGSGAALDTWKHRLNSGYAPRRIAFAIPESEHVLPGVLAERKPQEEVLAYICSGLTCSAPVTDFAEFEKHLSTTEAPRTDE